MSPKIKKRKKIAVVWLISELCYLARSVLLKKKHNYLKATAKRKWLQVSKTKYIN